MDGGNPSLVRGVLMRSTIIGLCVALCAAGYSLTLAAPPHSEHFDIFSVVPPELLRQANGGRDVLREDGFFAFPESVRRVWVDVGAHYLETTGAALSEQPDLGLLAIEPLAECWGKWPKTDRLIGLPVALYLERGQQDFNVNAADVTSSLAKGRPGAPLEELRKTVEVRSVPVLRLEDVLERVPPELEITYLKTDVQSLDLQVLKSGGEQLRRVFKVRAEVITEGRYEDFDGERSGTEQEFVEYMESIGFRFLRDVGVQPKRVWLDKEFVNVEHEQYERSRHERGARREPGAAPNE